MPRSELASTADLLASIPMNTRHPAVLRHVLPSDDAAILDAFTAQDMARQGDVRDPASAAAYARRLSENPFAFALNADGSLLGVVAVNADHENRLGWFWYWTHHSHRHRGLTKRAAATVANWALRDGGIERLELGHRATIPPRGPLPAPQVSCRRASSGRSSSSAVLALMC